MKNTQPIAISRESQADLTMTLNQVAVELRCSVTHVRRIIAGRFPDMPALPVIRMGRCVRVRYQTLSAWLRLLERRDVEVQYVSGRFAGRRDEDWEGIAGA